MSSTSFKAADIVRREWWVVGLAVLVALGVGLLLASQGAPQYVAKANVDIDQSALSRSAGLATPDQVERGLMTAEAKAKIAAASGVSASDISANGSVFISGSPAKEIVVQYRSTDRAQAQKVANAMQAEALRQANLIGAREIDRVQALIDETVSTLADMPKLDSVKDASQRANLAYQLWSLNTQLTGYKASIKTMQNAYAISSAASAARESVVAARTKTLAATLLLGVVLGVGVAAVREGLLLRRSRA